MKRIAIVFFVGGCKLLHRSAPDADVTSTSPSPTDTTTTTVAATAPTDSVALVALDASAAPSASVSNVDAERIAARNRALEEAREFGMMGLIDGDGGGTELGAGGMGPGIGSLEHVGTFGHADGGGLGRLGGSGRAPSLRMGTMSVNGRLPPEVIQRIVRQSFGRFRVCYENGLRLNPQLQGRVATQFIIGRDGSVTSAKDNGSDMPDQTVTQCVVRAFANLSYPQPEGGIVTVVAPIIFSPPP